MIYFAQMDCPGSPIKIGFTTKCLSLRVQGMASSCPYPVKFLAVMDGHASREKEIHRQFREHRTRGEWFRPHDDLLKFIAAQRPISEERALA